MPYTRPGSKKAKRESRRQAPRPRPNKTLNQEAHDLAQSLASRYQPSWSQDPSSLTLYTLESMEQEARHEAARLSSLLQSSPLPKHLQSRYRNALKREWTCIEFLQTLSQELFIVALSLDPYLDTIPSILESQDSIDMSQALTLITALTAASTSLKSTTPETASFLSKTHPILTSLIRNLYPVIPAAPVTVSLEYLRQESNHETQVRNCKEKTRFDTPEQAQLQSQAHPGTEPYHCPHCNRYHLTTSIRK